MVGITGTIAHGVCGRNTWMRKKGTAHLRAVVG